MKALIQRVNQASVTIHGETVSTIDKGLLLLLGVEKDDGQDKANRLLQKVLGYRIFADELGKMNQNLQQVNGGLLIVSQFTLVADTAKGLRPSFSSGASPALGEVLYDYFVEQAKASYNLIATGRFGADMQISLINDGPVTFLLEV